MCVSARACEIHVNAMTTAAIGSVHAYITPPDLLPHSKQNRSNDGNVENDAMCALPFIVALSLEHRVYMHFVDHVGVWRTDFVCRRIQTKRAKLQILRTISARMQNASSRVAKLYLTDESRRRCRCGARSTFFYGHAHPPRVTNTMLNRALCSTLNVFIVIFMRKIPCKGGTETEIAFSIFDESDDSSSTWHCCQTIAERMNK